MPSNLGTTSPGRLISATRHRVVRDEQVPRTIDSGRGDQGKVYGRCRRALEVPPGSSWMTRSGDPRKHIVKFITQMAGKATVQSFRCPLRLARQGDALEASQRRDDHASVAKRVFLPRSASRSQG